VERRTPSSGFFYKPVGGRRASDKPEDKKFVIDWWKIVAGVLCSALLGWGTWVTVCTFSALDAEEKIDMQTQVLHNRITGLDHIQEEDETRMEDRLWDLQQRFYEDEIEDCLEQLNECTGEPAQ
jgi:hypothetical protein